MVAGRKKADDGRQQLGTMSITWWLEAMVPLENRTS